MPARRKRKKLINWNLIIFILTLVTFISSIFSVWNQKETNLLKAQLDNLKAENDKLKDETEPQWHVKFNSQKTFYENEINLLNSTIYSFRKTMDSVKNSKIISVDTNSITISKKQAINILRKIKKAEIDSIGLQLYKEQNDILIKSNMLKDTIIDMKDSVIRYADQIQKNYELEIDILNQIIELYKDNKSVKESNTFQKLSIFLLALLLSLAGYIWIKKIQRPTT